MNVNHIQKQTFYSIRGEFLVCLFLILATTFAYSQVRHYEFTLFDDDGYVSENPHVRSGITRDSVRWAFSINDIAYWHPVTWLSHMLDTELFGLNPGMHHGTNLIFHIANSLALFLMLRWTTGAMWRSAFVAALFALHPMNVESVAWIAERKNVLSTFFWMLTLMAYGAYAKRPGYFRYVAALLSFVVGLMAKPMLVTLPFMLLLMDYWPLDRIGSRPGVSVFFRLILEKIPFLMFSAISIWVSSVSIQRLGIVITTEITPLKFRIANALISYVKYIGKMFWPHPLAVFYPYPSRPSQFQAFVALLVLAGISILLVRVLRKIPGLGIGWLWYIGTLVPVIGLVQTGLWPAMADRWAYVPYIGLFIIIAWGVPEILKKWRYKVPGLAATAAVVLSILGVTTWTQVQSWRNSISLFENAVDVHPKSQLAHYNLGVAYENEGRTHDAMARYQEALRLSPGYSEARNDLGLLLAAQGRMDEAIHEYSEVLRLDPGYGDAHNNLGAALLERGRTEEAVKHFREALQIDPGNPDAHNNMGIAMIRNEEIEAAFGHFQASLQKRPDDPQVLNNLNELLKPHGIIDSAILQYRETLRNNPDSPGLHFKLGNLFKAKGELDNAIVEYQQELILQPDFEPALRNLAITRAMKGEYSEALAHLKKIIDLWPNHSDATYYTAVIYAKQNQIDDAIEWLGLAVDKGYDDWERIRTDKNLDTIRNTSGYRALLKKQP